MSKDLKYVLLPTIEHRYRLPKHHPWYRERLKIKYPSHINTKNWKFVKDGLDDFRDGLPPSHDSIIIESDKGPSPVVLSDTRSIKMNASNIRHRLKSDQIYLKRELPTIDRHRQLIDQYISAIFEHPTAFFTHFNQSLTPNMYERITKLLEARLLHQCIDGDSSLIDESKELFSATSSLPMTRAETCVTDKTTTEHSTPLDTQILTDTKNSVKRIARSTIVYDEYGNQCDSDEIARKQKNPYRWFIDKEHEKLKPKEITPDNEATKAMETRLRYVSEQFCQWLHDVGGEPLTEIDPIVVRNLFSTAYDIQPAHNVPIKIVEMRKIPSELHEGVEESMISTSKTTLPELHIKSKKFSPSPIDSKDNSPRKYRYGAWYLPKNLWQRSLVNEQLRDPKEIKAEIEDVSLAREEKMKARLAPLHGIDSFKEYLVEQNTARLPKLITDVEKYRQKHPREIKQ